MPLNGRSPNLAIELEFEQPDWLSELPDLFEQDGKQPSDRLREAIMRAVVAPENPPSSASGLSVAILFSRDERLAILNELFRGMPKPTNVLSFPDGTPAGPEPGAPLHLGDLAISLDTVQREAADQSKALADHTLHLVVHGVLHLLGFDHDNEQAALEMETHERHILADMGIGDPYLPDDS